MGWILHSIFLREAALNRKPDASPWATLPRLEQWHLGWTEGPAALWKTLTTVDPAWISLSILLMGTTLLLGVLRWRMALRLQGIHLSLIRTGEISLVAHFFNSFLLGSTGGDLLKAYYAARETHHLKTEAVVTVVIDRLIGLVAMLGFAAIMMLPNRNLLSAHRPLAAIAAVILIMLGSLSLLGTLALWGGLSKLWPGAREQLRTIPLGGTLLQSLESCRPFGRHPRFLANTALISTLLNTVCVLQVAAVARGLHLQIPTTPLLLIVPSIICISALPITPSGLGLRENLFVVMLAVPELGVPHASALSLSLLTFAGSLLWSLFGGLVYAFFHQKHHLADE